MSRLGSVRTPDDLLPLVVSKEADVELRDAPLLGRMCCKLGCLLRQSLGNPTECRQDVLQDDRHLVVPFIAMQRSGIVERGALEHPAAINRVALFDLD